MLLIIESIILCALFTLIMLPRVYKNPVGEIMSYPKAIRKRVETLSEYKDSIITTEKKHIIRKILAIFILAIILAIISYFSGAKTFSEVLFHTFILFFTVNIYDMIVLDIIIFCNSKRVRIKGTEDMIKEYKNPAHHIIGAIKGTFIGIVVGLMSGGLIELFNLFV